MSGLLTPAASLREAFQENPSRALAIALIVLSVVGYLLLLVLAIIPAVTAQSRLSTQLDDGRRALNARQTSEAALPANVATRVADARATLGARFGVFATEAQVGEAIDALYRNARASGVTLSDLQTQSKPGPNALYQTVTIKAQVQGSPHQVLDFASRINQVPANPVVNTLSMLGGDAGSTLLMEIALYTSPYAGAPQPSSDQPPTAIPTQLPTAPITITPSATLAVTVTRLPPLPPAATTADTFPPRPGYFLYVVRRGDTLVSIARRYGTTVQALIADYGLIDANVFIGRPLYIRLR
jgi:hypothetical protein